MRAEILAPVRYPPPMPGPVIVTESGHAVLPLGIGPAGLAPLGAGLMLDWAPAPELGGTILTLGANGVDRIATVVTRATLRELIASLQSIDAQLEELARG